MRFKGNANPYHRNLNTVRTTPRKKFGSGPVTKRVNWGRCKPDGPHLMTMASKRSRIRGGMKYKPTWRYT